MNYVPLISSDNLLIPTEKLFSDDPYLKQTEAKVIFVQGPYVVTDKTIFYAESGGQASDAGSINEISVSDVSKRGGTRLVVRREGLDVPAVTVDTVIIHTLSQDAPFKVGDTVSLKIDWDRRYNLMRYHSASHFLYQAAHNIYDNANDSLYTKGCSISDQGARFDFFGDLAGELVSEVEKLANKYIAGNSPIVMEAEPLTRDIHYWRCGEVIIPCGGTHVRSTQELSPIKVKRTKKGQTTTRLSCVFTN